MLVGVIGLGKIILVDGIVNYVVGVSFEDLFRFIIVQLEEEEKKIDNQVFLKCFNCIVLVYENKYINVYLKYK